MQIFLYQNEQQIGPFDENQIRSMVSAGTISQTDMGWHEGLAEWKPLNAILSFVTPPPPPISAPQPPPMNPQLPEAKSVGEKKKTGCAAKGCLVLVIFFVGAILLSVVSKNASSPSTGLSTVTIPPAARPEKSTGASNPTVGPATTDTAKSQPSPVALTVQAIAANQNLWPKAVTLKENVEIPLVAPGKAAAGNMTLRANSNLELISVAADGRLDVMWNGISAKVPAAKTDIVEAVTQIQKKAAELKAVENARKAAEDAKPKPTQAEANAFVGLKEQELISRLGQPIRVRNETSPDGPFKMLIFSETKGKETFFTILASDGVVSDGYYRGVLFSKSTLDREAIKKEIGPQPAVDPWDKSVPMVKRYLETRLKDPKSTEYIEWSDLKIMPYENRQAWAVFVKYRSKNSFGGYAIEGGIAYIRQNEVVGFKSSTDQN